MDEDRQIGAALSDMARLGVRSLLVVNELNVVGFITSYDIEGERPIQYIQQFHDVRRNEVQVGQVMTRWHDLVTLNWSAVRTARVIDVLQALRDTTHAPAGGRDGKRAGDGGRVAVLARAHRTSIGTTCKVKSA